jgi:imidazolonepropionase-like amidohydrolase
MVLSLRDLLRAKRHTEQQKAKDMAECLAHGITHIRCAFSPDVRVNRAQRERISKGEIPGPRIIQAVAVGLAGSYLQEKQSLVFKIMGEPEVDPSKEYAGAVAIPIDPTERQVRDAVDIAIDERGAEAIKIADEATSVKTGKPIPTMTIEQLSVVADQSRRRGIKTTMHETSVASFRRGVKAGVSSIAHLPNDAHLTQGDVDAFKASGCINEPTISVTYAVSWKLEGNEWNDHPEMNRFTEFRDQTYTVAAVADEYFVPELRASVMNGYKRCASGKPKMFGLISMSGPLGRMSPYATIGFENLVLLYEQGVRLATGNDAIGPCTPAMIGLESLVMDLALKSDPDRKPLSGAEAVKIATIHSAQALGLEVEFGSIESGKTADLVILDGDPLEDFRVIGSRVAALFMDGKLVINNCGLSVESAG